MILKLKTGDGWRFVEDIQEAHITRLDTQEPVIAVQYHRPNRALTGETFVIRSEAYLMNDNGKTIESLRVD